jgi:hypothetical protein
MPPAPTAMSKKLTSSPPPCGCMNDDDAPPPPPPKKSAPPNGSGCEVARRGEGLPKCCGNGGGGDLQL